jgi:hypothetical protein
LSFAPAESRAIYPYAVKHHGEFPRKRNLACFMPRRLATSSAQRLSAEKRVVRDNITLAAS